MSNMKKLASYTISPENLEKLVILAHLLQKSKSKFIDDLIAEKFNEIDKTKILELMDKTIEEIETLQS